MKNIVLIGIVLFVSLQINAQSYNKIIPVEEAQNQPRITDGMYFKDVNHIFEKYIGTWEGSLNGKTYKITLKKTVEEVSYIAKIKEEYLQLRYRITENGKEIGNTLSLPNDNGLVNSGNQIYIKSNHINYYFVYGGKEILCGQSGDLLLQTTSNPNKIKLKLYPEGGFISKDDCPNGPAEQVFPTEEWLVLHKKK